MSIRGRLRRVSEDIGGCFAVAVGLGALLILFLIRPLPVFVPSQSNPAVRPESIRAGTVSGADLQKRLDDIAAKKLAIEAARLAAIRAKQEAKRKAEQEKRLAAEKVAREKAAKEKAAREKAAKEKAAREKAAREKAAREKAAREKAAREKTAKEKAAREKAAREKAAREKAAREKAAREKAAREKAKLAAIDAVPALSSLSSYDAQAVLAAKNAAIEAFRDLIFETIRHSWSLPPDLSGDLPVQLIIRLNRQGMPIVKFAQPSGCPLCDAQAIRAVKEASPFSLPDNRQAREELLKKGLVITFNPRS